MTGERVQKGDPQTSLHEATQWFVELESGQAPAGAALASWEHWISKPEHREEYAAVVQLNEDIRRLVRPHLPNRAELLQDASDPQSLAADQFLSGPSIRRDGRRVGLITLAVAASALIAALGGAFLQAWLRPHSHAPLDSNQLYSTATGEQREFTFSDGSRATLGGDTALMVNFTTRQRTVRMTRGEGMFRVQHESERPFVVCAREGCVTAVGTIFDVHLYSDRVRVWVQEGTVQVASVPDALNTLAVKTQKPLLPIPLTHGQEVSFGATGGAGKPKPTDIVVSAAWTQGWLIYRGSGLKEVIEDVQRYTPRRIVVEPAAGNFRYSGSVMQQHVDQWIHGLTQVFPVDVLDCSKPSEREVSYEFAAEGSCADDPTRIVIRVRSTH